MIYFSFISFIFFISFITSALFACEIKHPDVFALSLAPEEKNLIFYNSQRILPLMPEITISDCQKVNAQKKYLMIALGPENLELTDRVRAFNFTTDYQDSGCWIKNSPFPFEETFELRKKELQKRWNTLRSCLQITLQETVAPYLDIPSPMELCEVERINSQTVNLRGGLCFLRPLSESNIKMTLTKNKTCLSQMESDLLNPFSLDLEALLNFYIAQDFSGTSIDLNSLESVPLRLTLTPYQKLIPLSDDLGGKSPQFPAYFELFDTHLGAPEIKKIAPNRFEVKPFFWVHHLCSQRCHPGSEKFCQSICSYTQPFFGKFELFEINSSLSPTPVESWFDGGVIRPRFQGEISGYAKEIRREEFNPGATYRLEGEFSDPKGDFEGLKADYLSRIKFPSSYPTAPLGRGLPEILPLPPINSTQGIPEIRPISEIRFSSSLSSTFELMLENFSNSFSSRTWPPYIEKICHKDQCQKLVKKPYLILGVDFKIIFFNEESQKYKLKILRQYRKSPFLSSYDQTDPLLPEIKCPYRKQEL